MNPLERIAQLEQKHQEQIALIKGEAITELTKQLAEAKAVVANLTAQYEKLTGKKLTGDKAGGGKITRKRLSTEEKTALVKLVAGIIKNAHDGVSMGNIVQQSGQSVSAVREAVKAVKGVKKTGAKASTLYFVK